MLFARAMTSSTVEVTWQAHSSLASLFLRVRRLRGGSSSSGNTLQTKRARVSHDSSTGSSHRSGTLALSAADIQDSDLEDVEVVTLPTGDDTPCSFTFTKASPGATFVMALVADPGKPDESQCSEPVIISCPDALLPPLSVAFVSNSTIHLTWSPYSPLSELDGYRIWLRCSYAVSTESLHGSNQSSVGIQGRRAVTSPMCSFQCFEAESAAKELGSSSVLLFDPATQRFELAPVITGIPPATTVELWVEIEKVSDGEGSASAIRRGSGAKASKWLTRRSSTTGQISSVSGSTISPPEPLVVVTSPDSASFPPRLFLQATSSDNLELFWRHALAEDNVTAPSSYRLYFGGSLLRKIEATGGKEGYITVRRDELASESESATTGTKVSGSSLPFPPSAAATSFLLYADFENRGDGEVASTQTQQRRSSSSNTPSSTNSTLCLASNLVPLHSAPCTQRSGEKSQGEGMEHTKSAQLPEYTISLSHRATVVLSGHATAPMEANVSRNQAGSLDTQAAEDVRTTSLEEQGKGDLHSRQPLSLHTAFSVSSGQDAENDTKKAGGIIIEASHVPLSHGAHPPTPVLCVVPETSSSFHDAVFFSMAPGTGKQGDSGLFQAALTGCVGGVVYTMTVLSAPDPLTAAPVPSASRDNEVVGAFGLAEALTSPKGWVVLSDPVSIHVPGSGIPPMLSIVSITPDTASIATHAMLKWQVPPPLSLLPRSAVPIRFHVIHGFAPDESVTAVDGALRSCSVSYEGCWEDQYFFVQSEFESGEKSEKSAALVLSPPSITDLSAQVTVRCKPEGVVGREGRVIFFFENVPYTLRESWVVVDLTSSLTGFQEHHAVLQPGSTFLLLNTLSAGSYSLQLHYVSRDVPRIVASVSVPKIDVSYPMPLDMDFAPSDGTMVNGHSSLANGTQHTSTNSSNGKDKGNSSSTGKGSGQGAKHGFGRYVESPRTKRKGTHSGQKSRYKAPVEGKSLWIKHLTLKKRTKVERELYAVLQKRADLVKKIVVSHLATHGPRKAFNHQFAPTETQLDKVYEYEETLASLLQDVEEVTNFFDVELHWFMVGAHIKNAKFRGYHIYVNGEKVGRAGRQEESFTLTLTNTSTQFIHFVELVPVFSSAGGEVEHVVAAKGEDLEQVSAQHDSEEVRLQDEISGRAFLPFIYQCPVMDHFNGQAKPPAAVSNDDLSSSDDSDLDLDLVEEDDDDGEAFDSDYDDLRAEGARRTASRRPTLSAKREKRKSVVRARREKSARRRRKRASSQHAQDATEAAEEALRKAGGMHLRCQRQGDVLSWEEEAEGILARRVLKANATKYGSSRPYILDQLLEQHLLFETGIALFVSFGCVVCTDALALLGEVLKRVEGVNASVVVIHDDSEVPEAFVEEKVLPALRSARKHRVGLAALSEEFTQELVDVLGDTTPMFMLLENTGVGWVGRPVLSLTDPAAVDKLVKVLIGTSSKAASGKGSTRRDSVNTRIKRNPLSQRLKKK